MRGLTALRLALSSMDKTMEPLGATRYVMDHGQEPKLAALEGHLVRHLAAAEDALAHVRRMQIAEAREPTALEKSVQRKEPDVPDPGRTA